MPGETPVEAALRELDSGVRLEVTQETKKEVNGVLT